MIPPEWRYRWNNSGGRTLVRLRGWADAVTSARPWLIRSLPDAGGIVLAYGGEPPGRTHVLPFLEQRRGAAARHDRSRTNWSRLTDPAVGPEADILLVGCSRRRVPPVLGAHTLLLPFRVTLVVPVGSGPTAVLDRISRKARQQHLREMRSRARTLEIATGEADFEQFYDGMHLPTMMIRHGGRARSEPKASAQVCLFQRGVLFFLRETGRRVAGMLCRPERETLVVRLAGVAVNGPDPYRSGTYMSMFILILQWAGGHGFTAVDLSGCEPFLTKGTFQFKRKMHPEVRLPDNHFRNKRLLLRVCRDNTAVREFLVDNPVLAIGPGGFQAVYFQDDARPARLDLPWRTPGVTSRRLVHLDPFLAGLPRAEAAFDRTC